MSSFVIFIAGPPATGKTNLSNLLASKYRLPILGKDNLKEILFDELGIKDRQWSRELGKTSMALLSNLSHQFAKTKISFIVESNFHVETFKELVGKIKSEGDYKVVVVNLFCSTDILLSRFEERFKTGRRHPGHFDQDTLSELRKNLELFGSTLLVGGDFVFNIDTTHKFDFLEVENCLDQLI